jgi:general L-amino acid transport system permease protein
MTPMATGFSRALRRAPMFRDRANSISTAVLGACIAYLSFGSVRWATVNAIWTLPQGAGSSFCRAAKAEGACWAVIHERFRFILFGTFPFHEQWRPALVCLLFVLLYLASAVRAWWKPWLLGVWITVPIGALSLLHGGLLGLSAVPTEFWGGLPLTFVLSTVGFAAAFPVAVLLAIGRRSEMPVIRVLSITYIELIRGVWDLRLRP